MKQYRLIMMMLLACLLACPAMTSCSDDDPEQPEGTPIERFDQQAYLQDALTKVDESGSLVCHKYGYPLDVANPYCLSVRAADLAAARAAFKELFSPDVKFTEADGGVTANLEDEDGNSQGYVSFTPTTGESDGAIARVTFHTTPAIKFVTELRYLPVWEEDNAWQYSLYYEGEQVKKQTLTNGMQNWVCFREATPESQGMLVYISSERVEGSQFWGERVATMADAIAVSRLFQSNKEKYSKYLKDAGQSYWSGGNFWVWYSESWYWRAIDLTVGAAWWPFNNPYPYLQVEYFNMAVAE